MSGDWGVEAEIMIDGGLLIGRRFETRALALQWAEMERPSEFLPDPID